MSELVVVGAGGLAREALALLRAERVRRRSPGYDVMGLVDEDPASYGTTVADQRVLGGPELVPILHRDHPNLRAVLCLGNPHKPDVRLQMARKLGLTAGAYATLVHPDAALADNTEVGPGSILLAGVVATADVRIGAHVVVMPGAVFTHDDIVEDGVTVTAGVRLAGGVHVEEGAYLGQARSCGSGSGSVPARSSGWARSSWTTYHPARSGWATRPVGSALSLPQRVRATRRSHSRPE